MRTPLSRVLLIRATWAGFVGLSLLVGPTPSAQTSSRTRADIETLASDRFEGRQAGSAGERLAGDYIAAQLARMGAKPLPGRLDMFVPFEFTGGSKDGGSRLAVARDAQIPETFGPGDVLALSFSDDGEVTAPAVFAGYGLIVPASQNLSYDSYASLDVKDKVVVVLRYSPEDADPTTRAALARYSDLRYKAMAARQHGAKALIVVAGPRSTHAGEVIPMSFDTALAGSGIAAASASGRVSAALFSGSARSLADVQRDLDTGNPHVAGFALPGVTVTMKTTVVREKQQARNVIAYLPATSPVSPVDHPWVALGAHYDHLGHGGNGTSLASKDEASQIHHGADDNASGTAAVLAIAEALSKQPRRRNLLVALWSGEEIGLVGSSAFVAAPPVPIGQIGAYLNFDMVGRMKDNKLIAQATGTSPVWTRLLERANVAAGFDLVVQPDPYQPTDVATFNEASVPSLALFTGSHVDYHRPSDTADKIDYDDLDRLVAMASAITKNLLDADQAPPFTKVERAAASTASMAGVRVTTGTIPDYATEVKGLLLGGVIGGGPAEKAGLAKGDIVVELAGQTITNIYDYTFALELLKAGEPVKVIYMRAGARHEATLTPAARP